MWTYKWLLAKAQKFDTEMYVTGVDMTAAFDTIDRQKLLSIYREIINDDEVRMVKSLISDTTLEIKIPDCENSTRFTSNIGSPQGDGISGVHFNVYLENAMKEVREIRQSKDHDYVLKPPPETVYADDADFISETTEEQQLMKSKSASILAKFNLKVNEDKTELTTLKRQQDRPEERWRKTKKLGSVLSDEEDIQNRKNLASATLTKLQKIWNRSDGVRLKKRLLI